MRAIIVMVLVACAGSKPPPAAPVANTTPVVAAPEPPPEPRCRCASEDCLKLCAYRDRMCACKDAACGDALNEGYSQWMAGMAKDVEVHHPMARSAADARAMGDEATEYQACYSKLNGAPGVP